MPRAYLIAVCTGSSVDSEVNNFTLFNLIEELQVPELPIVLPFEVHVYWEIDDGERDREFEMRLLLVGGEAEQRPSEPIGFRASGSRVRFRGPGLAVSKYGAFHLCVEARLKGTENWHKQDIRWPLLVKPLDNPG